MVNKQIDPSGLAPDEAVSAFVDGCLGPDQSAQVAQRLVTDPDSREAWHRYHVIGDVLRDQALAPSARELEFAQRVQKAIAAQEPPLQVRTAQAQDSLRVVKNVPTRSANQDRFSWKMIAGVAVLGLAVLIGMGSRESGPLSQSQQMASDGPTVNQAKDVTVGYIEDGVMLRNPELDALLMAHQQMGGHSALQMPSGFLRNATFDRTGR